MFTSLATMRTCSEIHSLRAESRSSKPESLKSGEKRRFLSLSLSQSKASETQNPKASNASGNFQGMAQSASYLFDCVMAPCEDSLGQSKNQLIFHGESKDCATTVNHPNSDMYRFAEDNWSKVKQGCNTRKSKFAAGERPLTPIDKLGEISFSGIEKLVVEPIYVSSKTIVDTKKFRHRVSKLIG